MLYPRHISEPLLDALSDTPVVVLHGPRQTGKSTLARILAEKRHPATYVTLDDLPSLNAALNDPAGFIAGFAGPVVLDEIQRAPNLLLAIKAEVDRDRRPGRFLLTGSAHVLSLPRLADALAGRMETLSLWPLSQGELEGVRETFLDAVFEESPFHNNPKKILAQDDLLQRILRGGFPEAVERTKSDRRRAWFESYISTVLQRDVRDLANISGLSALPRLLEITAFRAGDLLNYSDLARDAGLNVMTLRRYFTLLNSVFLTVTIHPWFTNRIKRLVKSEKLYLVDTGLLAHLLNVSLDGISSDTRAKGMLLENFVAAELMKQRGWSHTRPGIYHYRHHAGTEVDFVLEAAGKRKIVGIEVKSASTVGSGDFKGLYALREALGKTFFRGIVLYTGQTVVPFAENLHAVPIQCLWNNQSKSLSQSEQPARLR